MSDRKNIPRPTFRTMLKHKDYLFGLLMTIVLLLPSCTKWEFERTEFFQVISIGATGIQANFATLIGDIANQKEARIVERGFVLSASMNSETSLQLGNPQTQTYFTGEADTLVSNQAFAVNATGLNGSTNYYFRAYAQIEGVEEVLYGSIESFTTLAPSIDIMSIEKENSDFAKISFELKNLDLNESEVEVGLVWSDGLNNHFPDLDHGNIDSLDENSNAFLFEIQDNQTYFVRVFLKTSDEDVVYSLVHAFTTKSEGSFQKRASVPISLRNSPLSFAIDHQGYIGGGLSNVDFYSDLWTYQYETDSWLQTISDLDTLKISNGSVIVHEGIAYILSGRRPNDYCDTRLECANCNLCPCTSIPQSGFDSLIMPCECYSQTLTFNPIDNSWKSLKSNLGLKSINAFKIGDEAFVVGGEFTDGNRTEEIIDCNPSVGNARRNVGNTGRKFSDKLLGFQLSESSIRLIQSEEAFLGGRGRVSLFSFVIGGKGYFGGGYTGSVFDFVDVPSNDFYELDPTDLIPVKQLPDFPQNYTNGIGFAIGQKGYVMAGSSPNSINEIWEFDPLNGAMGKWELINSLPSGPGSPIAQASFMIGNQAFVYFSGREDNFWSYIGELE